MAPIIASTYEVLEKLGAGGGGTVYLANHLRLGKKVVLKADKRKITTRQELLRREVDVLKNLSHPNIPTVYDFFVEDSTVYTVMEFIPGESLDRPLKRGEKYPQPQVIRWAIQLLGALNYLHSPTHGDPPRGFVHSDIKPANLMRTPDNNICLIDFNIALALGEENIIGCSIGYASPEHYGLDLSTGSDTDLATLTQKALRKGSPSAIREQEAASEKEEPIGDDEETSTLSRVLDPPPAFLAGQTRSETPGINGSAGTAGTNASPGTAGTNNTSSRMKERVIVPDIRSDIYSTGATLYHLLSGKRPARNAWEVEPLSEKDFSPQVVRIITRAMNPNPDLRYQTAEEMLYDFTHLRDTDPRVLRYKRATRVAAGILSVLFLAGAFSAFIGLKRIQTRESWLKLAEYSANALETGDTELAINEALEALPEKEGLLIPSYTAEAQKALTDALAVYDLCDGYKASGVAHLPSAPFSIALAPDGKRAGCLYAYEAAILDTETAHILATLPAVESALAEVKWLDAHTLLYAGRNGLTAWDADSERILWTGAPATSICISADKSTCAAIYRDEGFATVYNASDGTVLETVDFQGRHPWTTVNDVFANPRDNLLALNEDGSRLAASFSDGSLTIFNRKDPDGNLTLWESSSGYTHFEGGFYQNYFACAASNPFGSQFLVIDTDSGLQTGGFDSASAFGVQADETGICLQTENLLVKIHPVTGEQTPLVTTSENILRFAASPDATLASSAGELCFYDAYAHAVSSLPKDGTRDLLQLAGGAALIGSMDSPSVRILRYVDYPEEQVFSYDSSYLHDEARISADETTVTLFAYDEFRVYRIDGTLIAEVALPQPEQVYDQQFHREGNDSWLEVIYNDGTVRCYSASDGSLRSETRENAPDPSMYEEFLTDRLRITSPLHGTPEAYDRKTGKRIRELEKDDYLTYVTQAGGYTIVQYMKADGSGYGQLLNDACEVLAELPCLCDVKGDQLYFDYPTGHIRVSHIYDIQELIQIAREYKNK